MSKSSRYEALVKAHKHPIRARALAVFRQRKACASELSEILGEPLNTVNYHVKVLADLELIEQVERRKRGGSVATYYESLKLDPTQNVDWQELDPKDRAAISGGMLESLISDASKSLATGAFDRRPDRQLSCTSLSLDEKGWLAIVGIVDKALERILTEGSAAAQRLKESQDPAISATIGFLLFENGGPESPIDDVEPS